MPHSNNQGERLNWRKAKRSMNNGNCAEVATTAGVVVVRDTQDPKGLVIGYPADSWRSFIVRTQSGLFDFPR
jgi:hypothetical protein